MFSGFGSNSHDIGDLPKLAQFINTRVMSPMTMAGPHGWTSAELEYVVGLSFLKISGHFKLSPGARDPFYRPANRDDRNGCPSFNTATTSHLCNAFPVYSPLIHRFHLLACDRIGLPIIEHTTRKLV